MSTSKSPLQRYEEKLLLGASDCIGWTGKIDRYGNAQFTWTDDEGRHRTGGAHAWAWRVSRGPIPADMGMRNTCGLKSCQNLDHWRLKPRSGVNSPWEKYEARVDRSAGPDACHPWTEGADADGYPILTYKDDLSGKSVTVRAQRWAWDQIHPDDQMTHATMVCHRCDNPPCCNEAHWFKDTAVGNMADMTAKGRATGPGRGEKHHKTTVTQQFIDLVRAEYETAGRPYGMQTALARKYQVDRRWLADVLNGNRWTEGPEAKVHAPRTFQGDAERQLIFDRDKGICQLCDLPVDPDLPYRDPETGKINLMSRSIDHIIPVARGGAHSLENAQLAHFGCNQSKNVKVRSYGT
jgi:hypothetical protein